MKSHGEDHLMTDIMSPSERSARMALIKAKNTKPELIVRRIAHQLGYRFRIHRRDLPGTPDIVFPSRWKVIYVHGCFWHHHTRCAIGHLPLSRREYWAEKFRRNVDRDARNMAAIRTLGWTPLVVWECETRDVDALRVALVAFLGLIEKDKPGSF